MNGLTGTTRDVRVAVEAPASIAPLPAELPHRDIDLRHMAQWAMNYLIRTPRKELNYEPVFQCYPLRCPPVPAGRDVVVPCDTDGRLYHVWGATKILFALAEDSRRTGNKESKATARRIMLRLKKNAVYPALGIGEAIALLAPRDGGATGARGMNEVARAV